MRRRPSRILKACVAVLLAASFLAWRPVMMASMARMDGGMSHPTHTQGGHHQHALPLHCCTLCTIACATGPSVPGAAMGWAAPQFHYHVRPAPGADNQFTSAPQYRLPFSIGPPAPRLA